MLSGPACRRDLLTSTITLEGSTSDENASANLRSDASLYVCTSVRLALQALTYSSKAIYSRTYVFVGKLVVSVCVPAHKTIK